MASPTASVVRDAPARATIALPLRGLCLGASPDRRGDADPGPFRGLRAGLAPGRPGSVWAPRAGGVAAAREGEPGCSAMAAGRRPEKWEEGCRAPAPVMAAAAAAVAAAAAAEAAEAAANRGEGTGAAPAAAALPRVGECGGRGEGRAACPTRCVASGGIVGWRLRRTALPRAREPRPRVCSSSASTRSESASAAMTVADPSTLMPQPQRRRAVSAGARRSAAASALASTSARASPLRSSSASPASAAARSPAVILRIGGCLAASQAERYAHSGRSRSSAGFVGPEAGPAGAAAEWLESPPSDDDDDDEEEEGESGRAPPPGRALPSGRWGREGGLRPREDALDSSELASACRARAGVQPSSPASSRCTRPRTSDARGFLSLVKMRSYRTCDAARSAEAEAAPAAKPPGPVSARARRGGDAATSTRGRMRLYRAGSGLESLPGPRDNEIGRPGLAPAFSSAGRPARRRCSSIMMPTTSVSMLQWGCRPIAGARPLRG